MNEMITLPFALFVVFASFLGQKFKSARKILTISGAFLTFLATITEAISVFKFGVNSTIFTVHFGILALNFGADFYGLVFASLISLLWGIALLYSYSYLEKNYPKKNDTIFQICYSLAVFFAILFAFAKDVLTMFIIYECLTVSTIALVGFKKNEESKEGLFKYLSVLFGCSLLLLLPATIYIISKTGMQFFDGTGFMGNFGFSDITLKILLAMMIFGVGKAAIFPFHIWLPSAMCAPTPVSGLLHAVAVVKVGAFFIFRIVTDVFGIELLNPLLKDFNFIMIISGITIVYASITAVFQSNLKKRLAFSTIGQISYIILSLSTFTKLGVFAAMFQIVTHALSKILLFFTVGGFYTAAHSNQIVAFTGMAQKNKITSVLFLFATLSICGLPFTAGFTNKALLLYALIDAKSYFGTFVLAFSAFLSFLYLIPVCYAIFKRVSVKQVNAFEAVPRDFNIVFILLAILNIIVFILSSLFFLYYVNEW